MKRLFGIMFVAALLLPAISVAMMTPEEQTKAFTDTVIEIIHNDKDLQANGSVASATDQIDRTVLQPHFNFSHMTALAMGKEWRKATPEQKELLIKEFKALLVKTYSSALTIYTNPKVRIKTSRYQPTDTQVQIRTQVLQPGRNPVDIDYGLELLGDEWKVYDVIVAGVSLVTNYRDFFTQEVRKGGIEGAINSLKVKNQEPAKK